MKLQTIMLALFAAAYASERVCDFRWTLRQRWFPLRIRAFERRLLRSD
jgi:hypothetical protein